MISHDGTPMVCTGSMIHGVGQFGVMVDQTPVQVAEMLKTAEGLVEFTKNGVSVYVAADAPITAITPTYDRVEGARMTPTQSKRHCWLRGRRHRWVDTTAFRFGPGAFNRGHVLRCLDCKHETATSNPDVLARAERAQPSEEDFHAVG